MEIPSPSPIRILLLDYNTLVREGLRMLIESNECFQIAGETGCGEKALALASQIKPDIILLELNLDGELNTEIIAELILAAPQSRLILLTGIDDRSIRRLAVQMGAVGIISKTENHEVLFKALQKVNAGEVWIDRTMMASVLNSISHARNPKQDPEAERITSLSEREREVVTLIGQGKKNKEIAKCLTISETTVRHHLSSIYNKLNVADRLELSIYAYRNGLAELPT
jgi:two-component system nitrate/nitrite response regulator NarL